MPLRDLLHKKDKLNEDAITSPTAPPIASPNASEFTFLRTDTNTQEVISPPDYPTNEWPASPSCDSPDTKRSSRFSYLKPRSRASSNASNASYNSQGTEPRSPSGEPKHRRLSHVLGLKRETSSEHVPQDLPTITADGTAAEDRWEERATILARENEKVRSRPITPAGRSDLPNVDGLKLGERRKEHPKESGISTKETDDNIQEAIRLHEAGQLEEATQMFGRLADPKGQNNALSQVLYGLALRHGWGCTADPDKAVDYLSKAAANAANIENMALASGRKQGGAAKGELVLAIFELANSFRHGWGVKKDPVAAKQYYETAANLGDTDAMNEVAWCYLEGHGCKKDKLQSAKYYRLAEKSGNKTLGNTWIWKEKYDPPKGK